MSTEQPTRSARAGWYPHPTMADTQRYWNGGGWTDHVAPAQPLQARPSELQVAEAKAAYDAKQKDLDGLYLVAQLSVLLFWPVAIYLGARLHGGGRIRQAWTIFGFTAVVAVLSFWVSASLIPNMDGS